ncbi:multiple sugar transport system permease protein [Cryobacterium flavum]|uniref:Multiple sugar transport system permease protein n=1 Tax=Cryobacterium flavum TaxID=1424659 RepID=A0A4V3I9U0_9MICO|nr:sugar ABC transporter permease [Cryobacterium flavum]TFB77167.1 sugar ABC transporter permease [Cryobacterium flavum]SDN37327.1 multiple sugar transport system permease protein [Cryobacterium flavum]
MVSVMPQARPARTKKRVRSAPYIFIGLAVLYLLFFTAFPLLTGVNLSFTNSKLLNPSAGSYVGFDNYTALITSGAFMKSVYTTLIYTVATVIGCLVLGTASALVINGFLPGRAIARTIMVLPWAVPTVALALVFRWIYNDTNGIAGDVTQGLGLGQVGWLIDPNYGMLAVVIATVWKLAPFVMLIVLAALQSVPEELYEATRVDGADAFTTFKQIVLPQIAPTMRVVALLMTIWSFRRFEIIWLLTGGGPVDATTTIVINVYRQAFNNGNLGLAAAAGVLGLLLSLIVTVVYFFVEQRATKANGIES